MKDVINDKKFGVQFAYILDAITPENYDVVCNSDAEKVKFVLDTFDKEYNHQYNKRRWPNLGERLCEWFRGLPSAIGLEWRDYYINEIGKSWGFERAVNNGTFLENWFSRCAMRLLQLARKLDIDTTYLH